MDKWLKLHAIVRKLGKGTNSNRFYQLFFHISMEFFHIFGANYLSDI